MPAPEPEKRATRRFAWRLPVRVQVPQHGEVAAHSRDISARGICFCLEYPLAVSSSLEFTMTLPPEVTLTESIQVRCTGRVVRVEDGKPNGAAIAAVIDRYEFLGDRQT